MEALGRILIDRKGKERERERRERREEAVQVTAGVKPRGDGDCTATVEREGWKKDLDSINAMRVKSNYALGNTIHSEAGCEECDSERIRFPSRSRGRSREATLRASATATTRNQQEAKR